MSTFIKSALIRAIRTVFQELATTIPAGIVITPVMIQHFDTSIIYVIIAWLVTGLLGGLASFLTSLATGLPEADYEMALYMNHDEPEDAEIEDEN